MRLKCAFQHLVRSDSFRKIIAAQGFKCAGCGMALEKAYLKRVRYCAYTGRYFCLCCHRGDSAVIPAMVMHKWDFRAQPVCDFACKLLEQQRAAPLFNLLDVNPSIYSSVKALRVVREVRERLACVWDFLRTCRVADTVVTKEGL